MMSFGEAVWVVLFEKYATFRGRAARSEYWWWYLFFVLVQVVLNAAEMEMLSGVFIVLVLIPHLAVTVRRLHDINLSGWWVFFYYVTPFLFFVLSLNSWQMQMMTTPNQAYQHLDFASENAIFLSSVLWIVISFVSFIIFCFRGTYGANRYGTDPLR